MFTVYFDIV